MFATLRGLTILAARKSVLRTSTQVYSENGLCSAHPTSFMKEKQKMKKKLRSKYFSYDSVALEIVIRGHNTKVCARRRSDQRSSWSGHLDMGNPSPAGLKDCEKINNCPCQDTKKIFLYNLRSH